MAFLPGMMKRNHGHVVNISSAEGLTDSLYEDLQQDSHIRLTRVYSYVADMTSDLLDQLYLRIPELFPEHAAREIVSAVRHNKNTVSVPHNLFFWLNVVRTLPQDARDIWRDLLQVRASQGGPQPSGPHHREVTRSGIKT
jgi:short-subunit dehydrogenase